MPALTIQEQVSGGLEPLLKSAAARASRLGRPVLASYTGHLGPASHFDVATLVSQPDAFIWEQPNRGFAFAGVGQAVRFTASGEARFATVQSQLGALLSEAVVRQESGAALPAAPHCVGGFAFDPALPDELAWFGYPDALIAIPRLAFIRAGSHLFITASALAGPEGGIVDQIAGDQAMLARRLYDEGLGAAPQAAPAYPLDPGPDARELWTASVEALTGHIAAGRADKVVLARRAGVEADEGGFDTRAILTRLRERFHECTVFAVRSGEATFLGATPETLVSLQGDRVRTDCLAGSARRGKTPEEDAAIGAELLADDKERREHAFVASGIVATLAQVCDEVNGADTPTLKRMANVQHLHTPIEARLGRQRHVLELVQRLHPTAATAGLPREAALNLIREQEPFSRGWYAGPIGWIDAEGGGEFAVALRSGLVREDVATLYAGCGIVRGSEPEREWAESEIKLEAMRWALNAKD